MTADRSEHFSVAFDDSDVDESPIAKIVAERFETTTLSCTLKDQYSRLSGSNRRPWTSPFAIPAFVPTLCSSEMTKRHVKVALSGDGGDRVFGGYPEYLYSENGHFRIPFSSWIPDLLRRVPWRPRGMGRISGERCTRQDQI